MKKLIAVFMTVGLFGCADKEIVYTPVKTYIPVPVRCQVEPVEKPQQISSSTSDSLFVKVRNLIAENETRKAYELKIEAALKSCR